MSSTGSPMPREISDEITRMVCSCVDPEIVRAIREGQREVREIWANMTDEQIANWIMGIAP